MKKATPIAHNCAANVNGNAELFAASVKRGMGPGDTANQQPNPYRLQLSGDRTPTLANESTLCITDAAIMAREFPGFIPEWQRSALRKRAAVHCRLIPFRVFPKPTQASQGKALRKILQLGRAA